MNRKQAVKWAVKIQKQLAIPLIYHQVWPNCEIRCLDDDNLDPVKTALDKAGADKMIIEENDNIFFLGQRFRTYQSSLARGYDDFTLRKNRPKTKYRAEGYKARTAQQNGNWLIKYYAYGHLNQKQTGFLKFRILNFNKFLEQWQNNQLPPDHIKTNHDESSTFYSWKFNKIPETLIYWQLDKPITQTTPEPNQETIHPTKYLKHSSTGN